MKFKADRATLLKALAHVQSVVEKRNTIPILSNVMIAVRDSKLTLTATDMEIAIVEDVAAALARLGSATIGESRWSSTVRGAMPSWHCDPAATPPASLSCRPRISPR